MEILIIIGLISVIVEIVKEKTQPHIPAENWNNWDLIHKDRYDNHISQKEFEKNLRNRKYR